ncbi:MAG: ferredoxin family protein [Lachnospiraceae bacterium]|nr:ferredoxin family protein [Lachnospiraceae bacterium]
MSIAIKTENCIGCGRCTEVCPGNLIRLREGKAYIKRERDCWGCTSCLKECKKGAILFFLGADMGGRGSTLSIREEGALRKWTVTDPSGITQTIETNTQEANQY